MASNFFSLNIFKLSIFRGGGKLNFLNNKICAQINFNLDPATTTAAPVPSPIATPISNGWCCYHTTYTCTGTGTHAGCLILGGDWFDNELSCQEHCRALPTPTPTSAGWCCDPLTHGCYGSSEESCNTAPGGRDWFDNELSCQEYCSATPPPFPNGWCCSCDTYQCTEGSEFSCTLSGNAWFGNDKSACESFCSALTPTPPTP